MQIKLDLAAMILDLFDGEGGGAAPGAMAPDAGEQTGESSTPDAGEMTEGTPEDREARFQEMIRGEYKDAYSKEMQKIISKRVKDSKALEARLNEQQGVIDRMAQKYGIEDGNVKALTEAIDNDLSMWEEAADAAGMTTEQYVQFQALQRQNADLIRQEQARMQQAQQQQNIQRWMSEAEGVKQQFPGFDLEAELQNPEFVTMIKNGIPMDHAYKVMHLDDIMTDTARAVQSQTEKNVTDNIRAKGARPSENGSRSGYGASETKIDVHKLTPEGRQELIRRARNGEMITFT